MKHPYELPEPLTLPGKPLSEMIVEARREDTRTVDEIVADTEALYARLRAGKSPREALQSWNPRIAQPPYAG